MNKKKEREIMKQKSWLESIILALGIIISIVIVGLLIEITRGLIVLAIAAVLLMAIAIKKCNTKIEGEPKND